MAIKLENKTNVDAPDVTWPYGKTKDDTGSNDGTPLDHATLTDYIQFFAKMADDAGITFNGLPDNATNGWQYLAALKAVTRPGFSIAAISANASMSTYTAGFGDYISQVLFNFTGQSAAITFTLDASANYDEGCLLILKNNGNYPVTITPDGSDTVNGQTSAVLLPGAKMELMLSASVGDWQFKYGTNEPIEVGSGGGAPAYGSAWSVVTPVTFRRNSDGLVTIEGVAQRAAGAGSTSCFTLPVGFRPSATKTCPAAITDNVNPSLGEAIDIGASGAVQLTGGTGWSGYYPGTAFTVTLNCSFYAD